MTENDKLIAFGSWLTAKKIQHGAELFSLSINVKAPVDAVRLKAGHLEATQHILEAFTTLYKQDINAFMREYMGSNPNEEEDKESDGPSKSSP
jgi:hypothetical protein